MFSWKEELSWFFLYFQKAITPFSYCILRKAYGRALSVAPPFFFFPQFVVSCPCWSQCWRKCFGLTPPWCLLSSLAGATLEYIPHGQLANTHLTSNLRTLKLEQDIVPAQEERKTPLVEAVRGRKSFSSQDKTLAPINLTDDQLASGLYGNNWLTFTFHRTDGVWIWNTVKGGFSGSQNCESRGRCGYGESHPVRPRVCR